MFEHRPEEVRGEAAGPAPSAVAGLVGAVDGLLDVDLAMLDRDGLLDLLRGLEVQRRRLAAVDAALVDSITARGVPSELGFRTAAVLLRQLLHVSPGEARRRVDAAADLAERVGVSGEAVPPRLPQTAEAVRAGEVSAEHAAVIASVLDTLPPTLAAVHGVEVEATLLEHARAHDPGFVARVGARIVAHLDPDGAAPREQEQQRRRGLTCRTRPDGMGELSGLLTPEALAVLWAVLDPLATPKPAEDGTPDPRTAPQRLHDGLLDALTRLLRAGAVPDAGGVPATVVLHVREQDLRRGSGTARTGRGDPIDLGAALQLADEADVVGVVFEASSGGIVSYGRARRCASPAQRIALAARDKGCSFPGCDAPPSWCQAHHVLAWLRGGRTDLVNLTLLCGFHHRMFEAMGWACLMVDGVPHWIPPPWIDPQQIPRRNTAHDSLAA